MPADSEPALPLTFRPLGVRIAINVAGGVLLLVTLAMWFALPANIRDQFTVAQIVTVVGLGAMMYVGGYALARSRLVARADGRMLDVEETGLHALLRSRFALSDDQVARILERVDAIDPHHGGRGIAHHAARSAGIRRRDDGGEIADMHLTLEDMPGNRAADQGRCDVIQKAR